VNAVGWRRQGVKALQTRHVLDGRAFSTSSYSKRRRGITGRHSLLLDRSPLLQQEQWQQQQHLQTRSFWNLRGGGAENELEDVSKLIPPIEPLLNEYPVSVCSVRGYRSYMEDEFVVTTDCAAVFDGHGGQAVSRYLRQNLYASLQAALPATTTTLSQPLQQPATAGIEKKDNTTTLVTGDNDSSVTSSNNGDDDSSLLMESTASKAPPTVEDYEIAMRSALDKVDREVQRIVHWSYQGSTAVAVWIHEEKAVNTVDASEMSSQDDGNSNMPPQRTIVTANVGDSRAVLSRNHTPVELTRDHKPNDPIEESRIEANGGYVAWCGDKDAHGHPVLGTGIYRVNGNLALSRAIGDRSERPAVTAEPDITMTPITDMDEFLVLATDGLWDVMSSSDVVAFVHALLEAAADDETERDFIASVVVEEALRRGSWDNITVVIVWLKNANTTS
jgi:serine/threonine protein phosphatase PrpC